MNKEEIIKILEDYEFFVDDDWGGHYEHINCSQRALTPLGITQILDYITSLEQECKKQKEVIDKAIEYIEGHKYTMKHYEPYGTPTGLPNYETHNIKGYYKLLDILKEVSEC